MVKGKQEGLGDELLGTRLGELRDASGPTKGEFEVGEIEVAEPIQNWEEVLASLEYSGETVEITSVEIKSVIGKELAGMKWKTIHTAPDLPPSDNSTQIEVTDDTMREAIKERVLDLAEELCVKTGYAAGFRGEVYSALMCHIREKFLDNTTLGLADRRCLDYAWKMLDQVEAKVTEVPGLVGGMIEYANK